MNVGKAIRLVRTTRGLTQKTLALKAECSPNYLSLIERGARKPSLRLVEAISSALGVPPNEIFALAIDEGNTNDPDKLAILSKLKELMLMLNTIQD